jgi:probable O-glycosylation ligase (exosortase A-associated)
MGTIATYDEDRSALGRLESWAIAYEIATDRPFLGGGFWVLPQPEMRARFNFEQILSAPSIYFAILGDHGFVTFGLFVGLLISCLVSLRGLRRRAAREPDLAWLVAPAKMLEVSLFAFMVSGAFQTEAYFDLFYHVVAGVILLRVLAARKEAAPAPVVEPAVRPEAAIATGRRALPAARAARAARAEGAR